MRPDPWKLRCLRVAAGLSQRQFGKRVWPLNHNSSAKVSALESAWNPGTFGERRARLICEAMGWATDALLSTDTEFAASANAFERWRTAQEAKPCL